MVDLSSFLDIARTSPFNPLNMANNAVNFLKGQFTDWQNRDFAREQSRRSENFARDQYGTQRRDAELDWQRVNEYNSPKQQMQRLREAGLNPHLIYGKGAENTASMVRSSQAPGASHPTSQGHYVPSEIPNVNWSAFADVGLKTAQTDNLHKQLELLAAEIKNKDASTMETLSKVDLNKLDFEQKKKWADAFNSLNFEEKRVQIEGQQIENKWKPLIYSQNLKKGLMEMGRMQMENFKDANEVKEGQYKLQIAKNDVIVSTLDTALAKVGVNKGDPAYVKLLGMSLGDTAIGKWIIGAASLAETALVVWGLKSLLGKPGKQPPKGRMSESEWRRGKDLFK